MDLIDSTACRMLNLVGLNIEQKECPIELIMDILFKSGKYIPEHMLEEGSFVRKLNKDNGYFNNVYLPKYLNARSAYMDALNNLKTVNDYYLLERMENTGELFIRRIREPNLDNGVLHLRHLDGREEERPCSKISEISKVKLVLLGLVDDELLEKIRTTGDISLLFDGNKPAVISDVIFKYASIFTMFLNIGICIGEVFSKREIHSNKEYRSKVNNYLCSFLPKLLPTIVKSARNRIC